MMKDDREQLLAQARNVLSNDEFDTFGSFVASELRGLRHSFLQRKLKRGIQKLILETADEDEDMGSFLQFSSPPSTSSQYSFVDQNPPSTSSQCSIYNPATEYTEL